MRGTHLGCALADRSSQDIKTVDMSGGVGSSSWTEEAGVEARSPYADWTQRVGAFSRLPDLIRQFQADPAAILLSSGIDAEAIRHPQNRAPYAALTTLLQEAARATECAHLGLLAGRMWHLSDLGILGEAVRHSPTIDHALQMLVVHQHLISDGGLTFLLRRGSAIDLGYAIYYPGAEGEQMYDAMLAAGVNFVRELCGPEWTPSEVFLPHAKPSNVEHYRSFFKVLPHFNAEFCALRFPLDQLHRSVIDADPQRLRAAVQLLTAQDPADVLPQVYRAVRRLLLEERHSGDEVARVLSMHRRTLNRRLQAQDTSFQKILDEVRFQVARELLAAETPLDDIAASLGYAAVTPFMRTFRRWAGTTPGQWRSHLVRQTSY